MKFALVAFATLAAAVSAADLPDCNLVDILKVVGGDNGKKCSEESKYSSTSGVSPTDDQFKVLCFNDACESYRNELKAAAPIECLVGLIFTPSKPLYATLITPIVTECEKRRKDAADASAAPSTARSTAPSPTGASPSVAPAPVPAPAPAPGPAC